MAINWNKLYAERVKGMKASEIREILKLLDNPDIISLAGGIPDPAVFQRVELASAYRDILSSSDDAAVALQYSVSEGYLPLRQHLVGHMREQGVVCTPENIIIVNGSQQSLDFIGKLLISANDTVLVQRPTYLGALQAFNSYQPVYRVLPEEGTNESIDSYISEILADQCPVKFGYVMSEFANPSGKSLSLADRYALLDIAERLGIVLVEDSAYVHLRYYGVSQPSLMAIACQQSGSIEEARVVYCGTFSKTVSPALRIGWVVAATQIIRKLVLIKQASDLHVSTINQIVMCRTVERGFNEHVENIRNLYRERRNAVLDALERHMPPGIYWTRPEGGMFVWVTLPEEMDGAALLEQAIRDYKVAFVPGDAFFHDRSGTNTIRLSFSRNPPAVIEEGVVRLARLIESRIAT